MRGVRNVSDIIRLRGFCREFRVGMGVKKL